MDTPPAIAVIPARLDSTRFPGKVLADLGGRPLLAWVYERVAAASRLSATWIATDSEPVARAAREFTDQVFLSRTAHATGSDRVAELAATLGAPLVLNVQADEPLIDPALIDALVERLASGETPLVTAASPLEDVAGFLDPNVVKVVTDAAGDARYFSRAPIPWPRDTPLRPGDPWPPGLTAWRHLGVYGFQAAALAAFAAAPQPEAERAEHLEQLRALHLGHRIRVLPWPNHGSGVDTPEGLARLRARLGFG